MCDGAAPSAGSGWIARVEALKLTEFQKQGYFESLDAAGLTAHGGDMNGFILLKGERAKLDELRRTDAFERLSMTLGSKLDHYGVVPGVTLEGMRQVMERTKDM